jgi:hypothetical protein
MVPTYTKDFFVEKKRKKGSNSLDFKILKFQIAR